MAQFPNIEINQVVLEHRQPSIINQSLSGKRDVLIREASYWMIDFSSRNYAYDDIRSVHAFLNSLDGMYMPFDLVLPEISYKKGAAEVANGYSNVEVSSVIGSKTILLRRLKANVSKSFKAGDLIRFANHSKVYQIVEDADSTSSGMATIKLHTALQNNQIGSGTIAFIDSVPFTVQLERDAQSISLSPGLITSIKDSCREVIN